MSFKRGSTVALLVYERHSKLVSYLINRDQSVSPILYDIAVI